MLKESQCYVTRIQPTQFSGYYSTGARQCLFVETTTYTKPFEITGEYINKFVRWGFHKCKLTFDAIGNWHHYFITDFVPEIIKPVIESIRPVFLFIRNPFHHKDKRRYYLHHVLWAI